MQSKRFKEKNLLYIDFLSFRFLAFAVNFYFDICQSFTRWKKMNCFSKYFPQFNDSFNKKIAD